MMSIKATTLTLIAAIAGSAVAVPASNMARADEHAVTNSTEIAPGVVFTLHSAPGDIAARDEADNAAAAPRLNRRCGADSIECDDNYIPSLAACDGLINYIRTISNQVLPNSPRDACLQQSGSRCCISWSKPVPGLRAGSLISGATPVRDQCVYVQASSGLMRDHSLNGVCLTQCLSNRPNGCS